MKQNHIKTLLRLVLFLMIGASILSVNYAQTAPSPTAQATAIVPDGTPTTPDENRTEVQDSDAAYIALIERLTNFLAILIIGGGVAGAAGAAVLIQTLLRLATLLASLTSNPDDDRFIQRIIDKIEGK